MQSALIVVKNVKFRSNLILAGQSIVEIVGQNGDEQTVSDTRRLKLGLVTILIFHIFQTDQNRAYQLFLVLYPKKS